MDPSREELIELAECAGSLRAALRRMRNELAAVSAEEEVLAAKLRALGLPDDVDDAKTTVETLEIAGLPGRRKSPARDAQASILKAAAVGAGLTLGLVVILLLVANLVTHRGEGAVPTAASALSAAPAVSSAPPPSTVALRDPIPPPPPPEEVAPAAPPVSAAPPVLASAVAPKPSAEPVVSAAPAPGASGAMTVVCTPKCDAISDNSVPLAPSGVVNLPVAAGAHKLVLSANGVKKTILVTVAPGQTRDVRVSMDNVAPLDRGF